MLYKGESLAEAIRELQEELQTFSYDGLVQLAEDLEKQQVIRGSWAGCVLSYRAGRPGSARRDRLGRARNAFTANWDQGRLSEEAVLQYVREELARRAAPAPVV